MRNHAILPYHVFSVLYNKFGIIFYVYSQCKKEPGSCTASNVNSAKEAFYHGFDDTLLLYCLLCISFNFTAVNKGELKNNKSTIDNKNMPRCRYYFSMKTFGKIEKTRKSFFDISNFFKSFH